MNKKRIKSLIQEIVIEAKEANDKIHSCTDITPVKKIKKKLPKQVDFSIGTAFPLRDNLDEWKNSDFAIYIKKSYMSKYKEDMGVSIVGMQVYLNRVKEAIYKSLGSCDNNAFKIYIDYFFDNFADTIKNRNKGQLSVMSFKDENAISKFVSLYKNQKNTQKTTEDKISHGTEIVPEQIEQSYMLGIENLVLDYGIVLAINFLISHKNINIKESANLIARSAYSLYMKGRWESVCKATEKFSPYSGDLKFKKIEPILNAIGKKLNKEILIKIDFCEGDKKNMNALGAKNG